MTVVTTVPTRPGDRRFPAALAAAVVLHLLLFAVMGLVRPRLPAPPIDDMPAVQLQLVAPPPAERPVRTRAAPAPAPRPAQEIAPVLSPLAGLAAPDIAERAPASAQGAVEPGCAPEDLILLSAAEKARCRNQINVDRARRAESTAEADRAERMAKVRAMPKVDGIAPEKRAYYDAVAAAHAAVRNDFQYQSLSATPGGTRANASVGCGSNRGQNKPKLSFNIGPLNYGIDLGAPGFLTEESRISPP